MPLLKTKVKASQINNLTDARYFAARGVEWLGFSFSQSKDSISLMEAKAIREWVDGVAIVAEIGHNNQQDMGQIMRILNPDFFQLPQQAVGFVNSSAPQMPFILELSIDNNTNVASILKVLQDHSKDCDLYVLDFLKAGITYPQILRGEPFDSGILKDICSGFNVLISLDFNAQMISDFVYRVNPYGINLSGGMEQKTGFKSFDEMDEIFDLLEQ